MALMPGIFAVADRKENRLFRNVIMVGGQRIKGHVLLREFNRLEKTQQMRNKRLVRRFRNAPAQPLQNRCAAVDVQRNDKIVSETRLPHLEGECIEMIGVFVGKKQMFERRSIESELHLFRIGIGTVVDADAVIERVGGGHAEIFSSAFASLRTEIAAAETRGNSLRRRAAHNGNCMLH